jgi:hypothetical protein
MVNKKLSAVKRRNSRLVFMVFSDSFQEGFKKKQKAGRKKRPAVKRCANLQMAHSGMRRQSRSTNGPLSAKGKACPTVEELWLGQRTLYPACRNRKIAYTRFPTELLRSQTRAVMLSAAKDLCLPFFLDLLLRQRDFFNGCALLDTVKNTAHPEMRMSRTPSFFLPPRARPPILLFRKKYVPPEWRMGGP